MPRPRGSRPKGKPRGRSAAITPEQERTFLQLVSIGAYPSEAAKQIGVSPQAITNRKKNNPVFAEALERSDATAQFNLVAQVVRAAQKDWRAAIAILERRWPELWSKPEVRAQLGIANLQPADVAAAVQTMLLGIAKRFAPPDAPDVDADVEPAEPAES